MTVYSWVVHCWAKPVPQDRDQRLSFGNAENQACSRASKSHAGDLLVAFSPRQGKGSPMHARTEFPHKDDDLAEFTLALTSLA